MKFYASLTKRSLVARIGVLVICIVVAYLFTGVEAKAQFNPPCVDSTPFCPCVLEDGTCMDIDTPIDDSVLLLLISGLLIGFYKLHVRKLA
jgi:hypothetical protein